MVVIKNFHQPESGVQEQVDKPLANNFRQMQSLLQKQIVAVLFVPRFFLSDSSS